MTIETPGKASPLLPVPELERRLAQQVLIAEFGGFALKNPSFQAMLDEACRIAEDGLEVGFAKVLEPLAGCCLERQSGPVIPAVLVGFSLQPLKKRLDLGS